MALTKEGGVKKWEKNFDAWVKTCQEKHNHKFTYPTSERTLDENGRWKLEIVCPEHGSFFQRPEKHKFGQGCPYCSNHKKEESPLEFAQKHWPQIEWKDTFSDAHQSTRINGVCPHHREFNKLVTQLRGIASKGGQACPRCAKIAGGRKARKPLEDWVAQVKSVFPDYTVNADSISTADGKVEVTCPKHGTWKPKLQDLVRGHGCPECWKESGVSKGEKEVLAFVESLGLETIENFHLERPSVLFEGDVQDLSEYDIVVITDQGYVFIDYHGMYYQGDKVKMNRRVHVEKLEKLEGTGIRYIQIFEDEWQLQKDKVKTRLAHILKKSRDVNYARKLQLSVIPWAQAETFYEAQHLQGAGTKTSENFALLDGEDVVACMSFAKPRFDKDSDKELLRFASKGSVVGGFSRLLKAFKVANPECSSLISYADRRWSEGAVYEQEGFAFKGNTEPNYAWYKNLKKVSRYDAQRHRLETLFDKVYDPQLTESDIMRSEGYWKVYDAGNSRWVLDLAH